MQHDFTLGQCILIIIACFGSYLIGTIDAEASTKLNTKDVIRAIIGEAADQGKRGMLAVACAIRNRGTLKGVYGLHAPHVDSEPDWVWRLAEKAWADSADVDIVFGADHWENTDDFVRPYWAKNMKETVKIGKHQFYKQK